MSEMVQDVETVIQIVLGTGDFFMQEREKLYNSSFSYALSAVMETKLTSFFFLKRGLEQMVGRAGETVGRVDRPVE